MIVLPASGPLTYDLLYNAPDAEIALTLDGADLATGDKINFGVTGEGHAVTTLFRSLLLQRVSLR